MKLIDLFNKITNAEELPNIIRIRNNTLFYNKDHLLNLQDYYYMDDEENATWKIWWYDLNDEVEIIEEKEMCHKCGKYPAEYNQTYCEFCLGISEEDKKIEKLELVSNGNPNSYALLNEYGTKCGLTKHSKIMCDKINEIIDKINIMEDR